MKRVTMERSGEMEVFMRVVQEGGFSAAARSLGMTPSAISKLISRLEERIGSRLFLRSTRALSLTEEGEAYYQAALLVIQGLNDAEQVASAGAVRGRLRINTSIPFGTMFADQLIPSFLTLYPDVVAELSLTDAVVDLQNTDVAIRMGNLPDSALLARKLGESRRVVCAAPDYLERMGVPKRPEDLSAHNCLTFNFRRERTNWPFLVNKREITQSVHGNLQLNNGETMKQMLLAGAGIGRVGLWHVAAEINAGKLIPVLEKYNPGDTEMMHAVYVGGGQVPQRVRAFIEHSVRIMKEVSKST